MPGCQVSQVVMELIYPREMESILIPRQLDGTPGSVIFEVAHRDPGVSLYWSIDPTYAGVTSGFHQLSFRPSPGSHTLTITDPQGNQLVKNFRVIGDDP